MDILDILFDVDDSIDWEEILNNIEGWVKAYYDAIASGEHNPEEYLKEVLPKYWQTVRAHNTYRCQGVAHLPSNVPYDVGIFLVGFSSLPIVLSIAEIQPRQEIYFLHSKDTDRQCNEITDRIAEMLQNPSSPFTPLIQPSDAALLINRVRCAERREIADHSDPVSTFRQIKDIIDRVGGDAKIALDLTGGKKTMIGGGFTAGSIYFVAPKCVMFYVDSLEYDERRGTPIPGTEFLSQLDNPYDVYNVQSVGQAKELFKRHNYEAAERLWKSVRDKLYRHIERYDFLEDERKESIKYYGSSHCYHPWDAFDYKAAQQRKTYKTNKRTHSWGYDEQHVHNTVDVLNILAEVTNKFTLYANERRVIHYAVDRYQNGMRRKQNRRLADAIVRFAQVIEIICNYRIYRLAQDNYFVEIVSRTPRTLPADKIWEFAHLIRLLFGDRVDIEFATYHVLPDQRMQEIDYGYENVDQIIEVIQSRNDFIHFNTPIIQVQDETDAEELRTETDTENLRNLAHRFLEKFIGDYCDDYFSENGLNLDCLLELHRFRR